MVKRTLLAMIVLTLVGWGKPSLIGKWRKTEGDFKVEFADQNAFIYEGTMAQDDYYYGFMTTGRYVIDGNRVSTVMVDYVIDEKSLTGVSKSNLSVIKAMFDQQKSIHNEGTFAIDGRNLTLSGHGITGSYTRAN